MWRSGGGIWAERLGADIRSVSPKPPQSAPFRTFGSKYEVETPATAASQHGAYAARERKPVRPEPSAIPGSKLIWPIFPSSPAMLPYLNPDQAAKLRPLKPETPQPA